MTALRLLVVALNAIAGVLMGMAVLEILGPGPIAPKREPEFDVLWLAFHTGPCAIFAGLAAATRRIGSRVLPITLLALTLAVIVPGVLVARFELDHRPDGFAPLHGALTFSVACVQYVVALVTCAFIALGWVWRQKRPAG